MLCLPAVAVAQETPPGTRMDFLAHLDRPELNPLYLAELRGLALYDASLWALRKYTGSLMDQGHVLRAAAFAVSVDCRSDEIGAVASLIRAEGLLYGRHHEKALATLESLVATFPVKPAMVESQYLRARCLFDLGRYEEARLHLDAIGDEAEADLTAGTTYYLALCLEELGSIEEARDRYEILHQAGLGRGTAGLMRCDLRAGRVEAAQDVYREAIVRGVDLPHDEIWGLLDVTEWGAPELWDDLMASLAADTTYVPTVMLEPRLLRGLERGADVLKYCEAFLTRGGPRELRYVRALALKDRRAAYDSLLALAAAGDLNRPFEYQMAMAYVASLDESVAMPEESRLARTMPSPGDRRDPNELVYWIDLLVSNGRGQAVSGHLMRQRSGLTAGFDDRALLELADLLDRAGADAPALEVFREVSRSPVPSGPAFACERRVYLSNLTPAEDRDVSSVVEQVAAGDRSSLDLAEIFESRLKDYAKAADYYQRAARETEDASERDRIRVRAAGAFANDYMKTGNNASRDRALNLASGLASSEAVSPREIIDLLKQSTEWLALDLFRATEVARQVAARDDLDDETAVELSRVLFRLYERGDAQAYDLCLGVLGRLLEGEERPPIVQMAAFLDARVRLLAGDYAAALDSFRACVRIARDGTVKKLCRMGMGDCYVGSGGLEEGLEHYEQAGDSPWVSLRKARCYQELGRIDDAVRTSENILDLYTARDVSVAARMLRGLLRPDARHLPRGAFRFYFERYHYLGMHEKFSAYLPLLAAYDLALRNYDGLAVRVLSDVPRAPLEGVHCQILLSGYDPVRGEHADFFRALAGPLAPNCKDALDVFAHLRLKAQIDCRSESDQICTRARERFADRFPLAAGTAVDIDAIRATSLYREMYVGRADAIVDSLFAQGVRSELLAEAVYRKGISFLQDKAHEEAKQTFLIMKDHFPASRLYPDVCFKLGTTCYLMEAYDSSAVFFRLAAEQGRATLLEDALFNLGLALEQGGDLAAASEAFLELAQRFPLSDKFERALMRGGYCLEENGFPMEARDVYKTLLEYARSPGTRAEANYWLGECLARAGGHVEAALEFMRTGFLYPGEEAWAGTARYRAGMECEGAGLMDAAKLIYEENVRTFGRESDWGRASYERLSELLGEG
jgi:tetratricopeptide (TPR) repeat protein